MRPTCHSPAVVSWCGLSGLWLQATKVEKVLVGAGRTYQTRPVEPVKAQVALGGIEEEEGECDEELQ